MDGGRNSKDRTRRGDDEGRSKAEGEVPEEEDGVPENNEVEQSQLASDVNEQQDVDGSQEHSLISEIEKSRRIHLDETGTTHIAKISEGKRSHRKVDYDDSNNEQSTSISRKYDKGKHPKSKKNTLQSQRPLLTYSTEFVEEVYEPELEDPDTKASDIKDHEINSIRDDDDDDPLIYNAEEKPSVNSVNTDVSNGNHEKNSNVDKDEKNQHGLSESRELFFNPHQVRMSLPSSRDFTTRNQSKTGQRRSANTDHDTSDTDRIFSRAGEEIPEDPGNNALDDQFEEESYGSESITLTNSHHERHKTSGSGKGILLNPIDKGVNKTSSITSSKNSGDAHDEDIRSVMNQIVSDQHPQENHNDKEKQIDPESDILDERNDRGENMLVNPVGDGESNSELRLISPETKPYTKDVEEIMDNPSDSDSNRKQDQNFDGGKINTSDDLGNDSWSPKSELDNDSWNAKTEQRDNRGEKETFDNPLEQRGSVLNSRSFSSNQYIENAVENTCGPDQCGLNFDPGQNFNDKEDEDGISPNKEIMSQHSPSRRESAVTFGENQRKDYNGESPSENLTLNESHGNTTVQSSSPQKMKVFDVILRPSHDDSASTNLSTDSLKTDKECRNSGDKNQSLDKESIGKRKREVIKINKELAPAVIHLLKKLEQIQSSSTSPSPNAPDENVAQELRRKKSLDDGPREQQAKHLIDSEKDMTEVSNFEKKDSKSRQSSTSKSKRLSDESEKTSRSGYTEPLTSFEEGDKDDNDQLPAIKDIRKRATSTSTSKGFCSAAKCQRTCKRCSGIKRNIEKGDSRGDRHQEDLNNIAPALEAVAEKLKDCLKIGCSFLKNVYYNQNLLRVFYFKTDPSEAEMTGEL